MKKNCLIIEDNSAQRDLMRKIVSRSSAEVNIFDVNNIWDAYRILLEHTIDVFIVDIVLETEKQGDTSGMELVRIVRSIPQYRFTPVIFVTSLEDPQLFAYRNLHCFAYLEKPYDYDEIREIVRRALGYTTPRKDQEILCLKKEGVLYPFRIDKIVYIESCQRNVTIHKRGGKTEKMPYMTCNRILEAADNSALIQCSRGVIVNRHYVKTVDKLNRILDLRDSKIRLPIGGAYASNVFDILCNEM
jgi:DNA-binding LytR/AlgR family response regulator